MPIAPDAERLVREAGLRVTRPEAAALRAAPDHPHADTDALIGAGRDAPSRTLSAATGVLIDEAEVVRGGRCPDCATDTTPTTTTTTT